MKLKQLLYEKFISEQSEALKKILLKPGKFLIEGVTGGGKTYAILNVFKFLSSLYKDRVFIISCPNKIQNLQNQEYGVTAIVGGKVIDQVYTTSSMVYDKAKSLLEQYHLYKDYKITLIIDEAHQLIYSKNFRKKAINELLKLSEKCFNVIHLTATPGANLDCYSYDEYYQLKPIKENININTFGIMKSKDGLTSLYKAIRINFKQGKKVLIFLNNKEKIFEIQGHLSKIFKDKNIGIITSDEKENNDIFQSIVKDSLIPSNYDIVLTTSVLECGTNIENLDYTPIVYVDNNLFFNVDSVIQQVARFRKDVDLALLIYKEPSKKENFFFKSKEQIATETEKRLNRKLDMANSICLNYEEEGHKMMMQLLIGEKCIDDTTFGEGILYYDEETLTVKIDQELFWKYVNERYDYQLLYDDERLLKAFKGHIKAKNIQIVEHQANESEEVKELKKAIKTKIDDKKAYSQELHQQLLDQLDKKENQEIFIDYIKASSDEKELFKVGFTPGAKVVIDELEKNPKAFNKIKKIIKENEGLGIDVIVRNNFDDEKLKAIKWLVYNQTEDVKEIKDTRYSTIRRILDSKIQKRLPDKQLEALYRALYPKSKIKNFSDRQKEKLLKDIKLIYNLAEIKTNKENFLKISSLKLK